MVALHGYALGSGLEMSLMCDFRLAAPDTVLGLPETKIGMLPAAGGTRSITTVLSPGAALPLVLSGDPIDARSAHRLGLVHDVVPGEGAVESAARELARRLGRLPAARTLPARTKRHQKVRVSFEIVEISPWRVSLLLGVFVDGFICMHLIT